MKIYKDGELYVEITSPDELLGMYQTIANNLRNNYFSNVDVMRLIASARSIYQVATMPSEPTINTVYYVGTEAPYDVKLVDSNGTIVPLGDSDADFSNFYTKTECDYRFLDKQNFLNHIFPKGSIFTTYENKNPSTFLGGTWVLIGGQDSNLNYYPAFAIATDTEGTTISESAPNIKASYRPGGNWPITNLSTELTNGNQTTVSGAFSIAMEQVSIMTTSNNSASMRPKVMNFDASESNPIYKDNAHVNVNAIKIFFWRRTDDAPIVYNTGNITMDTELDENATDDHIPTSKAVVDYVKNSGSTVGARLYRHSIKWGNSSDANSYLIFYFDTTQSTPYNTASEVGVAMNALGLNSRNPVSAYNHVNDVPGLVYTIYVLENGTLYYKNGPAASSYIPSLWDFLDDIVTPLYTISAGEIEGYRETRETITTSTYGSTGQGSSSGVQIPLTKGISNFDYIEIYAQTADNNQNHRTFRVEAQDLAEYYSQSKAYSMDINDTTQSRRWGLLWEENDTTLRLYYSNFKINKIVGISTKPIVVGEKPYKQLFVNATGATGTIELNDDITKFAYLEVFARRSDYIITTKISVARIINQNYKPLCNTAWANSNFWVFIAKVSGSNTQFTVNNQGSNGVVEVLGWY